MTNNRIACIKLVAAINCMNDGHFPRLLVDVKISNQ